MYYFDALISLYKVKIQKVVLFRVPPDLVAVDNGINPRDYLGKFWIDSLVHDERAMQFIIDVMGEDYICLGSDYPFPLGEHVPGKLIEEMQLDKMVKEKLFSENAKGGWEYCNIF